MFQADLEMMKNSNTSNNSYWVGNISTATDSKNEVLCNSKTVEKQEDCILSD